MISLLKVLISLLLQSVPLVILHPHSLQLLQDTGKILLSPVLYLKGVSVSRLCSMGGDVTCVTPDFNDTIWEQLYDTMPQSGKIGAVVHKFLQKYKEKCREEREKLRDTQESTLLFPVSFAYAKTD